MNTQTNMINDDGCLVPLHDNNGKIVRYEHIGTITAIDEAEGNYQRGHRYRVRTPSGLHFCATVEQAEAYAASFADYCVCEVP